MAWIKKFCEDHGVTQYQLGKMTGINSSSISTMVTSKTPISKTKTENVKKIAKSSGYTVDELYDKYDK